MPRIILIVLCVIVIRGTTLAQCVVCATDAPRTSGYILSYPFCTRDFLCLPGSPQHKPYANQLQPGLRLRQEHGRLIVAGVLPGSPAAQAGIMIGDEISAINGKVIGLGTCDAGWEFNHSGISHLVIRRGDSVANVNVRLSPVGTLASDRWKQSGFRNVAAPTQAKSTPEAPWTKPFILGIRVRESLGHFFVEELLLGSPADEMGIRVNDEIISVNGISLQKTNDDAAGLLQDSDYRRAVDLEILHANMVSAVHLRATGISQVLSADLPPSAFSPRFSISRLEISHNHQ